MSRATVFTSLNLAAKRPRRPLAHKLRGVLWLSHVLWNNGITLSDIDSEYLCLDAQAEPSGLAYKWRRGKTTPARRTAERIESELPGSLEIYDSPIFTLLDPAPLTTAKVRRLVGPYSDRSELDFNRHFPEREDTEDTWHFELGLEHSGHLVQRQDWTGAVILAGLVRRADALNDVDRFLRYMADLYRIYPFIAQLPWVYPHRQMLRHCLMDVRRRCPSLSVRVEPDIELLERLVHCDSLFCEFSQGGGRRRPRPRFQYYNGQGKLCMAPDPVVMKCSRVP